MVKALNSERAERMDQLVDYAEGSIVSRPIIRGSRGSLTLFAFDEGQELSEHTTPSEAVILVVDGCADVTLNGRTSSVQNGEMMVLPANVSHAVRANSRFKMALFMLRD
jgi:quercetin dioxygenase-like cupin family protein